MATSNMNERTPLIQTVIITRREPRYPHSTLRRFCTFCLGTLVILVALSVLLSVFMFNDHGRNRWPHFRDHNPFDHDHDHGNWNEIPPSKLKPNPDLSSKPQSLSYDEVADILLITPDAKKARAWNEYYSSGVSLAGKNLSQALWTREKWEQFGVKSEVVAYDTYLNYPVDHRLALLKNGKIAHECNLEEDILEEDPTTSSKERIPTFHGYSASGNVTAPYVFVNYGTFSDFEDLIKANVSLRGKIAIAKYGSNFRGIKVKRAEQLGMIGMVIYSDPQSDGEITELNGYKPYPEGPARNPSAVQRGSVQNIGGLPGDPTTPGYPSKPGVPRQKPDAIPSIPSIPISYQEAIPLLKALNGHGPKASSLNKKWHGGGLEYKGVEYNIGPTPDHITLNLYNQQEYVTTPIWDVIGVINGTIPDEAIIIGCHRDAWIVGGAGDPHSGSSALVEIVRSFGEAVSKGWKPMRTIVFASWDGEEYALLGSTEWVEEYLPWLSSSAIAYLNTDVAASGPRFKASAAPLLNTLIKSVISVVPSPAGGTVHDHFSDVITPMGSGSDFTAFQDHAGISSLNIGFTNEGTDAVYHYHSNYDSFYWMDKFGDPTFEYHITITKIINLIAAKLSESPVIPFDATAYSTSLGGYLAGIKAKASKDFTSHPFIFANLESAIARLHRASVSFDAYATELSTKISHSFPWYLFWKKLILAWKVRNINDKYKKLERAFLYAGGLDGRSWFKHVVFAPGRWTGYSGATYPGLVESILEDKNITNAMKWSRIIEERLNVAAGLLEG